MAREKMLMKAQRYSSWVNTLGSNTSGRGSRYFSLIMANSACGSVGVGKVVGWLITYIKKRTGTYTHAGGRAISRNRTSSFRRSERVAATSGELSSRAMSSSDQMSVGFTSCEEGSTLI